MIGLCFLYFHCEHACRAFVEPTVEGIPTQARTRVSHKKKRKKKRNLAGAVEVCSTREVVCSIFRVVFLDLFECCRLS